MWYILNLVRKVINTNKYSTSLISKITKITMIDIKIYGTIVFFVVFAGGGGGGGEKEFNAVIFNKKNFTVVWNHKYSWKTCVRGFRGSP